MAQRSRKRGQRERRSSEARNAEVRAQQHAARVRRAARDPREQVAALRARARAGVVLGHADLERAQAEVAELYAILDTATDGVVVLDRAGQMLLANRSAQALFGYETHELAGRSFFDLFALGYVEHCAHYARGLPGAAIFEESLAAVEKPTDAAILALHPEFHPVAVILVALRREHASPHRRSVGWINERDELIKVEIALNFATEQIFHLPLGIAPKSADKSWECPIRCIWS